MTAPPTTFAELMAMRSAEAPALIHDRGVVSFGELDVASRRVAAGLASLGIGAGDRVGVWLPNVPAWLALHLACARLGAIVVAINTRFRSAEIEDLVGRSGCAALALWPNCPGFDAAAILGAVHPAALASLRTMILYDEGDATRASVPDGPWRRVRYADLAAASPTAESRAIGDSPSAIFATSGTTRAPKMVMHRQAALIRHGFDAGAAFGYAAADACVLQATPYCGIYGFSQAMAALAAGCPSVLLTSFDAGAAAAAMQRHRVTQFNGTDEMLDRLLAAGDAAAPFPSLRFVGCARFNTMLGDIGERAEARGVRAVGLFGMSETQALFALRPPALPRPARETSGGIPVAPEARLRARDPESGRVQPHGAPGEIELTGPSLMVGYFRDDDATRAAFTADGFFRTGDLGYTEADGGFVFLSRIGDALRLGGYLVNPAEIESLIARHPSVEGCQVVSAPTPRGERAVAFVTLRRGAALDEAALQDLCRRGLAAFKVPLRVFALDAFPTATGPNGTKIQRARLRAMAAERMA